MEINFSENLDNGGLQEEDWDIYGKFLEGNLTWQELQEYKIKVFKSDSRARLDFFNKLSDDWVEKNYGKNRDAA